MEFSIDRLAQLARLQLSQKEKQEFKNDLERIVAYVDQLREVDTEGIARLAESKRAEIMHAASEINVLRTDMVSKKEGEENAEMIATLRGAFPESEEEYIRVPLVINKSSK